MNFIVIGAGLAGAACAYALAKRGSKVTVLSHGGGASTLPVGLLAAHLSAQDIELSQLSRIGLSLTLAHARALLRLGMDWQPCQLHQLLLFHPEKAERLRRGAALLPHWYEVHAGHVLHKQAAWIKPQTLANAWLAQSNIDVREAAVHAVQRKGDGWQALDSQGQQIAQGSEIIIAAGAQAGELLASCGYPLLMDNVSGSVAFGDWPFSLGAPQVINGNGHFIGGVAQSGGGAIWLSGATYERESFESAQALQAASLQANQERLAKLLPDAALSTINAQFTTAQVQSWQGIRCTTSDRLPIVGKLDIGLHVCTAMGSRGLSFAALCAEILVDEIIPTKNPPLLSSEFRQLLQPQRKTLKVDST